MRVEGGTALVEAVRLAGDGSGDVVVRLYEPLGARAAVRVVPSFDSSGVTEVDLLEHPVDDGTSLTAGPDGTADLRLRPFQVVTLRWSRR